MMNVSKDIKHGFDFVSVKDFITYEKAMEVNEHFECEARGVLPIKNIGKIEMYFVKGGCVSHSFYKNK